MTAVLILERGDTGHQSTVLVWKSYRQEYLINRYAYTCIILKWGLGKYTVQIGTGFSWLFLHFGFDYLVFHINAGPSSDILECDAV